MAFEPDTIIDRRRLKRRLTFWRLAVLVLILVGLGYAMRQMNGFNTEPLIARYHIQDVILDDAAREDLLAELADDEQIRAVIIRINSPGGSTAGSEALYDSIRNVTEKKPVAIVMGTVAASGGYMAALAGDRIFARNNTITGSIGVIFQAPNVKGLLDDIGVEFNTVKSSKLKAAPDAVSETDPEALEAVRGMVMDTQDWFVTLVADRRNMNLETAQKVSDGRVYTGRQALALDLIDEIGGEREARTWLETDKNIDADLPIVEVYVDEEEDLLIELLRDGAASLISGSLDGTGLSNILQNLQKSVGTQRLTLDGLVSVWNP